MNNENEGMEGTGRRRRRNRRRKPVYGLLPRFVVIGVVLLLGIGVIVGVVGKVMEPYTRATAQGQQLDGLHDQVNSTLAENTKLVARRDSLSRPEGIEVAARSEGYLRKGETRLVLENDPTPPAETKDDGTFARMRSAWMTFLGR